MKRSELEVELERETAHSRFNEQVYFAESDFERTAKFHHAMGLPVHYEPRIPSVSERLLRARLLMEETVETITKGLGITIVIQDDVGDPKNETYLRPIDFANDTCRILMEHTEGDFYDPVESLDGLADVKVIANGTALQFGLPLPQAEYEVYSSNMTKLDEDGKPVVNHCRACQPNLMFDGTTRHTLFCHEESDHKGVWIDGTKPLGKLLKPDTYVPANIARIIVESQPDIEQPLARTWLLLHGESDHD